MSPDLNYVEPDSLKRSVSLAGVASALGVSFNSEDVALCPFHDDRDPSLHLYVDDNDVERWVCHPCGLSGDVFDLAQRLEHLTFPAALERVAGLRHRAPPRPGSTTRTAFDLRGATALLAESQARATAPDNRGWLCVVSGLLRETDPVDLRQHADYLLTTADQASQASQASQAGLRWGIDHAGNIVMPHFDSANTLTGIKFRALDGSKWSFPGSAYGALYGSWRPRSHQDVLLVEGEGDMAYAALQAAHSTPQIPIDVYALPAGAARHSAAWETLQARRYFLAFDGDPAGISATVRWRDALLSAHPAAEVRICGVPRGHDLKSARPDVLTLLNTAVLPAVSTAPLAVNPDTGWTERVSQGNPSRTILTWSLVATARLEGEPPGIEVLVTAAGLSHSDVIRLEDLHSAAAFRRWSSGRSLDCMATESDAHLLLSLLLAQSSICPTVLQTARVGAHRAPERYRVHARSVVTPTSSIGVLPWRFTGPADTREHVHLDDHGPADPLWLHTFLALNEPAVTHPLLAWLAASARRDEMLHFPLLFLGGSSGSGKTTTARLAARMFGSSLGVSLASATQFTVIRALTASTTVPVVIDEWSLQSRQDARDVVQAVIPVIYERGVTPRGRPDLTVVEYRLAAPTLLAGEDNFNLDREAERMVSLRLRRLHQDFPTLTALSALPVERFAFHYNSWLVSAPALPALPAPASDRPAYNRAVLHAGWATLNEYLDHYAAPVLPSLDLSGLDAEQASRENEYVVYLRECLNMKDQDHQPLVWRDEHGRGIWARFRVMAASKYASTVDVELPGRSRAMEAYFSDNHHLVTETTDCAGKSLQATLIKGLELL